MLNIGVTKNTASNLDLQIFDVSESEMDFYLSESKIGRVNCALFIKSISFYTEIVRSKDLNEFLESFPGSGEIRYGIITSASLRAHVQTIVSKCSSLSRDDGELVDIEKVLNGIPWKFLGFYSPSELSAKIT